MRLYRFAIPALAVVGALLGALLGIVLTPDAGRYKATGDVAFLPAANLTIVEASNFWEVLTRGQVSRTAAVVYDDPRWLPSAANAAKVSESDLTLSAAAVPETTIVAVTVQAPSPEAAEAALNDVLTTATAEVASLASPYSVRVLWPAEGSAVPLALPGRTQVMAAGALAGILIGGGAAWYLTHRVRLGRQPRRPAGDPLADRALPQP